MRNIAILGSLWKKLLSVHSEYSLRAFFLNENIVRIWSSLRIYQRQKDIKIGKGSGLILIAERAFLQFCCPNFLSRSWIQTGVISHQFAVGFRCTTVSWKVMMPSWHWQLPLYLLFLTQPLLFHISVLVFSTPAEQIVRHLSLRLSEIYIPIYTRFFLFICHAHQHTNQS